jgi:superfamily II DNA helicase RecQ
LKCNYYHASLDADNRSGVLKAWLQRGGLITATSSLGTGVDYPEIVRVLHVDTPYSAIDFAQESGRAGREGQLVDAVILVESPRQKAPALDIPVDHSWHALDEAAIQEFINPRLGACRRSILSLFLDGQSVTCTQAQAANCDLCSKGSTELTNVLKQDAQEEAKLRNTLQELVNGCPVCWLRGSPT